MTDEILTLTAYFAERERSGDRFLAEAMLDLFDERDVATSVMLRGIASFGPTHVARSDRSLTLSEDPPVVVFAVDTAERISGLADDVAAMLGRGLVMLQRGHRVVAPGGSVRLSLYLGRRQRIANSPAFIAVCDVLHRLGFLGADVSLGVDGTVAGQRRRARFFSRNAGVPLLIRTIGTAAQAAAAVDELRGMLSDPLFSVEPIVVCKTAGKTLASPAEVSGGDPFQKLTLRTAEDTLVDGRPIHRVLIDRLKESDHASGATAVRGIWGFHGQERPHGDRFVQLFRHVPVSTVMIDTAEHIAATFRIVDELTQRDGLVTCESVPAAFAVHGQQSDGNLRLD